MNNTKNKPNHQEQVHNLENQQHKTRQEQEAKKDFRTSNMPQPEPSYEHEHPEARLTR